MTTFSWRARWAVAVCAGALLTCPTLSDGKQTRAGAHQDAQTTKATIVAPPGPNVVERGLRTLKSLGVFGVPDGFHPVVTTIYPGGWLALGGGYRQPLGDSGELHLTAAHSIKGFKNIDATLELPTAISDRVSLEVYGRWMDAPAVDFYGVGNETDADQRTTFAYQPTTLGVTVASVAWQPVAVGGGVEWLSIDLGAIPEGPTGAPASEIAAPHPGRGPRFLRTRVFAQVDWRDTPGYTGRGGLYRVELLDHHDRSGSHLSFRSAEAEAVQLFPILRANWVIALRGLVTVTDEEATENVPFYLMPSVGGNVSVRGYPFFRWLGSHRLLMNAEWRWTATRYLDMAIFYDTGKVAMRLQELDLHGLKSGYGIGARFHGSSTTVLRVEAARNHEGGWRLVWTTGAAF